MLIAAMTPVFGYVASPHTPHLVSHHHRRDFAPLALANGGAPLEETLSPELPIAADDECAAAVLDHMVKTHGQQWLDFEKFFSKKQVLRLVDMVLQGGPDSVEM